MQTVFNFLVIFPCKNWSEQFLVTAECILQTNLLLACLIGLYYFARWCLLSVSVVCNAPRVGPGYLYILLHVEQVLIYNFK